MMDTGSNGCMDNSGWDCILPEQVDWLKEEAKAIPNDDLSKGRGFLFMHIPNPEFLSMVNDFDYFGEKNEPVCCWSVNTGLFSAI